jgi:hypothetical protein
VIVASSGDEGWQRSAPGIVDDLSYFFRNVRIVNLPADHTPATLLLCEDGPKRLRGALLNTRRLAAYQQDPGTRLTTLARDREGPQL